MAKKLHIKRAYWHGAWCSHKRRPRVFVTVEETPIPGEIVCEEYRYKMISTGTDVPSDRLCKMCKAIVEGEWRPPCDCDW